jgi:hypothetical protein
MHITVLRKRLCVNKYLYYGIVLLLAGFQNVDAAQGERPTQQQSPAAQRESQPQPSAIVSPSPSQTAVQQPQSSVEAQKRRAATKDSLLGREAY